MMVSEAQAKGRSIHEDGSGRSMASRIGLASLNHFRNISEELGVDHEGHMLRESWGPDFDPRKREGRYDPDQQYGIPVRKKVSTELDLEDYSIRDLVAQLVVSRSTGEPVGDGFVRDYLNPGDSGRTVRFAEADAGGIQAVDYSLFYGITGQMVINRILQSYVQEEFVVTNLCGRYPTNMMDGERVPGVGLLSDPDANNIEDITLVKENQPLKFVGLSEEYIEIPQTNERQLGIAVTKKVVYGDRTGLVLNQASDVGRILGLRKEKRLIGVVIGGTVNPAYYREKRRYDKAPVTLDMYQSATGSATTQLASSTPQTNWPSGLAARPNAFVNDIPNNPMNDWTAFRRADQCFANTVDPNTGEPVVVGRPFVLLPYTKRWDLMQIVQALNLYKLTASGNATGAFATGQTLMQTPMSALSGLLAQQFATSRQLRAQMVSQLGLSNSNVDWVWFNGDFEQAVKYMENFPITVIQAPADMWPSFSQNIVAAFKAYEMGNAAIFEPRVVQRHNYLSESSGQ
jgi:hypothetical protein